MIQLLDFGVEGGCTEVVIILQQRYQTNISTPSLPIKVPSRLLSSRPGTRGLHPVGALTRPHEAIQELKTKKQEAYLDGLSRFQERLVAVLESVGLGTEFGLNIQDRLV